MSFENFDQENVIEKPGKSGRKPGKAAELVSDVPFNEVAIFAAQNQVALLLTGMLLPDSYRRRASSQMCRRRHI